MNVSLARTRRSRPSALPVVRPRRTVSELTSTRYVKVPSWFTAGAALRVARLKRVQHLLVVDRQAVVGLASEPLLAAAAGDEPLSRRMNPVTVSVGPDADLDHAWSLMAAQGADCLPVVAGALLLGVVTRDDLVRARCGDEATAAAG